MTEEELKALKHSVGAEMRRQGLEGKLYKASSANKFLNNPNEQEDKETIQSQKDTYTKPEEPAKSTNTVSVVAGKASKAVKDVFDFGSDKIGNFLFGTNRKTIETETLQELGSLVSDRLSNASDKERLTVPFQKLEYIRGILALPANPEEVGQILEAKIPGFKTRTDEAGNLIAILPDGQESVINKPGGSLQDVIENTSRTLMFLPALAVPGGPFTVAAATGIISVGNEAFKRALGADREWWESLLEIAIDTATGGFGRGAKPQIQKGQRFISNRNVVDTPTAIEQEARDNIANANRVSGKVEDLTGVDVGTFQHQKTRSPGAVEKANLLADNPVAHKKVVRAFEQQDKEVGKAVDTFFRSPEGTAKSVKNSVDEFFTELESIRTAEAGPLYEEAFRRHEIAVLADPKFNIKFDDIVKRLKADSADRLLPDGPQKKALKDAINKFKQETVSDTKFIPDAKGVLKEVEVLKKLPISARKLHNIRKEFDIVLTKMAKDDASPSAIRNVDRILSREREVLRKRLIATSDEFEMADLVFQKRSKQIKAAEETLLGVMKRMEKRNPELILSMGELTARFSPKQIRILKTAIGNERQWDKFVKNTLYSRIKITKPFSETVAKNARSFTGRFNVAKQIKEDLFKPLSKGNPTQNFINSASPEVRKNISLIKELLEIVEVGKGGAKVQGLPKDKGLFESLRNVWSNSIRNKLLAGITAADLATQGAVWKRHVKRLTDLMFDPKWQPGMKELRKTGLKTAKSVELFSQLWNEAGGAAIEALPEQQEQK